MYPVLTVVDDKFHHNIKQTIMNGNQNGALLYNNTFLKSP